MIIYIIYGLTDCIEQTVVNRQGPGDGFQFGRALKAFVLAAQAPLSPSVPVPTDQPSPTSAVPADVPTATATAPTATVVSGRRSVTASLRGTVTRGPIMEAALLVAIGLGIEAMPEVEVPTDVPSPTSPAQAWRTIAHYNTIYRIYI